jgi:hypothetical protein
MRENNLTKSLTCVNSFFEQPWWLDAVAPGHWDCAVIKNGGQVFARLPYVFVKRCGLKMIGMPAYTQTLGIYFKDTGAMLTKRLEKQKDMIFALIEQLPKGYSIDLALDHQCSYVLPFIWKGFRVTPRFSYRLENISDLDETWNGFRKNIRTEIWKAEKILHIVDDLSIDVVIELQRKTFQRQGRSSPYNSELMRRIDDSAVAQNARKLLCAVDNDGNIHAAGYFVYDERTCCYLMGGGDPELRNSGAASLVLWEGIKFASTVSKSFDFEGSMIEDIERFFRAFGGNPTVYYRVTKLNAVISFWDYVKPMAKKLLGLK